MTKNTKTVWLATIIVVLSAFILMFVREQYLTDRVVNCHDLEGPRQAIDLRKFETNYTGYSMSLEGEITGKGKLSGKIEPALLQKLSESIQVGQEFRKALVAGYNACAVTRQAYQAAVLRFQALDGLARQIATFAGKTSLSQVERKAFMKLVDQYSSLAENLAEDTK